MNRQGAWIWLLLLGLVVLLGPGKAGHLLLDLLGGLTLTVLLLPLLAAGAGFVGWQLLRRRLHTCPACGVISIGTSQCPACGTALEDGAAFGSSGEQQGRAMSASEEDSVDARDVTIDVVARSVDD